MILLIITEIRLVIHAIDHQSIQKITDLHVSVLLAPAPDIIHLPAHLLKIIERVRVFGKYLVPIILDPKVGQVHQAGIGGAADTLFHGFGRIAEFAAKFV